MEVEILSVVTSCYFKKVIKTSYSENRTFGLKVKYYLYVLLSKDLVINNIVKPLERLSLLFKGKHGSAHNQMFGPKTLDIDIR